MPEPREARSIIEDAEQAAATGNYAAAENLLREAAAVQEQTLGPNHPDLASTLNNLGVVCEMANNPIDAEHFFRRAYAIAAATLPPDDPFLATSSKNLHDFCAARGRPAELPPSPPGVAAWLEEPAPRAAPRLDSSPSAKQQDATPVPPKRSLRPLALGGLSGIALLIVVLMIARPWSGPVEETTSQPAAAIAPAPEVPSPKPTPQTAEPIAEPEPIAQPVPPAPPTPSETEAVSAVPNPPTGSAAMPTVVTAQLCTALRVWRCEAAESQAPPGSMFFYTQLKSATATTVEHRWYQGDRLRQTAQLRIQANPGAGYRTYSRSTVSKEPVADWRVELRSADGTLLQEERFTVR